MPIDQLSLDILWNRLIATVNEQAATLMRSSFTSIVREAGDLSAGVFDRRGRMVAQAVTGTPGHINSMATGVVHFLERFPIETIEPGDVLATNDPWKTASQLNDITVVTPVFKSGKLVALFANCCHASPGIFPSSEPLPCTTSSWERGMMKCSVYSYSEAKVSWSRWKRRWTGSRDR